MAEILRRVNRPQCFRTPPTGCWFAFLLLMPVTAAAEEHPTAANERFALQSSMSPGLLVPLYNYPGDVTRNEHWNRLIALKRSRPRVPVCAIVNPASGPGQRVDANYTVAIRRLRSAGIITIGYISTNYAKIDAAEIRSEIDRWQAMYPLVNGIFFDETTSQTNEGQVEHYLALKEYAHQKGCWPVFANPGTMIDEEYFAKQAADVFVIHETGEWPSDERLSLLETLPSMQLGVLVHQQQSLDEQQLQRLSRFVRWIYVTEDEMPNPWNVLSGHSEKLVELLDR
jgi:hypothetical protein